MSTQVKALPKIKIEFDSYNYERLKDLEHQAIQEYETLKHIADAALGLDHVQMPRFLKADSTKYLIDTYANLWLQAYPDHLDRKVLFLSQTNTDLQALQNAHKRYNELITELASYAPTMNIKGITSNIKKASFYKYLPAEKYDHYVAVQNLLDAIDEVRKYNGVSSQIYLLRAFPDLLASGLDLAINTSKFK